MEKVFGMTAMQYFYHLRKIDHYSACTAWASMLMRYCHSADELYCRMNNVGAFWRKHSLHGAKPAVS